MGDPFRWKVLLKALILPPTAPLLVAIAGLLILDRHPRAGRTLVACGVGVLFALSMPVVALMLVRVVDGSPVVDLERARTAQAIVILGGGLRRSAAEYGGDTMNRLTLERVRYGARLWRTLGLPVLVSGGRFTPTDATEAAVMKSALIEEFGVPVRWAEDRSRDTRENAQMSAALLKADGIARVVLVVHALDMPRATAEFAAAGITAVPAPTSVLDIPRAYGATDFLPSVAALQYSYHALYELYAGVWLRMRQAGAS